LKKIIGFVVCLFFVSPSANSISSPSVDLERYTGTWYEIARLPNSFQEKCSGNVAAQYSLLDSGEISVKNSCIDREGKVDSAYGIAWVTDPNDTSKLKVSFVPLLKYLHIFSGDYWIFDLDLNYEWAIVGSPDRKYLWFLSRKRSVSRKMLSLLKSKAKGLGFSIENLIITKHFKQRIQ